MTGDGTYWPGRRVCVTGGAGFLGRVLCRQLRSLGCRSITIPRRHAYDLTQADAARRLYEDCRPNVVINLAAEVGGIQANRQQPGRFFYANLSIGLHLIEAARGLGVDKFVQVGTVCSYPKLCPLPFREEDLWNGYPEETNAPYGIAKKALLVMLQAYRHQYGLDGVFVMPVNLYGPGDNFDPQTSHVIPAMIRKFHEAKLNGWPAVKCWGTGRPTREFLYVEDAAQAVIKAAEHLRDSAPVNIGTGREITMGDLAATIAGLVGFGGSIEWDASKPDGQPRRCLDVSLAARLLGWRAKVDLKTGLQRTIDWWAHHCERAHGSRLNGSDKTEPG